MSVYSYTTLESLRDYLKLFRILLMNFKVAGDRFEDKKIVVMFVRIDLGLA